MIHFSVNISHVILRFSTELRPEISLGIVLVFFRISVMLDVPLKSRCRATVVFSLNFQLSFTFPCNVPRVYDSVFYPEVHKFRFEFFYFMVCTSLCLVLILCCDYC